MREDKQTIHERLDNIGKFPHSGSQSPSVQPSTKSEKKDAIQVEKGSFQDANKLPRQFMVTCSFSM